jgi:hypothetical protein
MICLHLKKKKVTVQNNTCMYVCTSLHSFGIGSDEYEDEYEEEEEDAMDTAQLYQDYHGMEFPQRINMLLRLCTVDVCLFMKALGTKFLIVMCSALSEQWNI